jgi:hypothetical protein
MTKSFIDSRIVKQFLLSDTKVKDCLDDIQEWLYDNLMKKENYTKSDIEFLARRLIQQNRYYPLLHIDMIFWKDLDPNILIAVYKYLHAMRQELLAINPPKDLDNLYMPKYILLDILYKLYHDILYDYNNIWVNYYKYLPLGLQQKIYQSLKIAEKTNQLTKIDLGYSKYAAICSLLNINI